MKVYAWLIDLIHRRKNCPTGMISGWVQKMTEHCGTIQYLQGFRSSWGKVHREMTTRKKRKHFCDATYVDQADSDGDADDGARVVVDGRFKFIDTALWEKKRLLKHYEMVLMIFRS